MKAPCLILLVLAGLFPLRADILVNGNFADGRAHWKGDAKEIDSDNISASNQPGVTITLQKDKWTKIYQTFSTHEKKVRYNITFTLSPDYHVESESSDAGSGSVSPSPGLDDIDGMYPLYLFANSTSWTLIVEEFGARGSSFHYIRPDLKKTDSQTLTGKILGLTEHADKILLLAFPPGEGTITLTGISLTPDDE